MSEQWVKESDEYNDSLFETRAQLYKLKKVYHYELIPRIEELMSGQSVTGYDGLEYTFQEAVGDDEGLSGILGELCTTMDWESVIKVRKHLFSLCVPYAAMSLGYEIDTFSVFED